ncbi:sugar ABC transporter ATP-binding protein [Acuticoccus sp. MNP-M23]|uniref:sugar ABC transporter ATP-binding protein n=1 Tax=Acuticoccus sp. MNP-M23 TaxID=3072793 RepID=UPI002816773A|nr:sugar ABC transporter ATP-binding protein [Acuticoccus sp. MNP-M23]WMS41105.1 sugar ABC transporter ATP-binding protein [Acuticoccus sp. MNP-M23]
MNDQNDSGPMVVEMRGVSKAFVGVKALEGVDFEIAAGEIVCLAGENGSGKSTLIKSLAGAQDIDTGTIAYGGTVEPRPTPVKASRAGIQIIYQDFSLFGNLSVAENIAFNRRLALGRRFMNWGEARQIARDALKELGVDIPLGVAAETLPVAQKQLVAIARAIVNDAKLIVMDEPTTALTEKEVRQLLTIIRGLKARGIAILFVSHKLAEVFAVCERVMVLRNGQMVAKGPVAEFDLASLTYHMTGRRLADESTVSADTIRPQERLRVHRLSRGSAFTDISLTLHAGEVLGVVGLLGSGRTELAKALFGIAPALSGRIELDGREVVLRTIADAIGHGIGYVPEDRLTEGLFLSQSIGRNIAVGSVDRIASGPFIDAATVNAEGDRWVKKLAIATPSAALPVQSLSGGNQQRVVLARWLATNPSILILNGPTVGVDVGSKADIHAAIGELARSGLGVIVISDDIPEVLTACHRILVMKAGRIVDEVARGEIGEDELTHKLAA